MRTATPGLTEARQIPRSALRAASTQPVLSGADAIEHESNREILDAIDHAHQQLIAAEIAELIGIVRAADQWKVDQDAVGAGLERLIQPGHDGTPEVAEFLALELGALLGISQASALFRIGDALDLRHRHPQLWAAVLSGAVRVWQASKICSTCAHLPFETVLKVDAAIAADIWTLPWARVMKALPGQIINADPELAGRREQARHDARHIRVSGIENGSVTLWGVVNPVDGIKFDHVLTQIAQTFPTEPDIPAHQDIDRRRAAAFGKITQDAFDSLYSGQPASGAQAWDRPNSGTASNDPVDHQPIQCTLIVHVSADDPALMTESDANPSKTGVTRIEDWGPLLTSRLPEFLSGANVTVRPIINPSDIRPVDAYETPPRMRFALAQRNPVDVFPYGTTKAGRCDADHTIAYSDGRAGQTHLGNLGPLSRRAHRAKTHGGWRLEQPTPGVYHWTSPYGYRYQVTATGSVRIVAPTRD